MSKELSSYEPEHGARGETTSFAVTDRRRLARELGKELGLHVMAIDSGGFRVLGYSAADPEGVRRLVKRLKP